MVSVVWVAFQRQVALRKESVDRNVTTGTLNAEIIVALRKESVDRNFAGLVLLTTVMQSLSARRAWIEIFMRQSE